MITIAESDSSNIRAIELLSKQGYTYNYIVNYITDKITNDDRWFGIDLAWNSDLSNPGTKREISQFVKEFIEDYITDSIIELGSSYDKDYITLVDKVIKDNKDVIDDFNNEYDYLEDKQMEILQDEQDSLSRDYYNSVMPRR